MAMNWKRAIIPLTLLMTFLITLVVRYLQPSPKEVAIVHLVDQGWQQESLITGDVGRWSTGFMNITESRTLNVYVKGTEPLEQIDVHLSRPVYFLSWQVVEVKQK